MSSEAKDPTTVAGMMTAINSNSDGMLFAFALAVFEKRMNLIKRTTLCFDVPNAQHYIQQYI